MFYKVLFLELLACASLVGWRVYQALPTTTLAVGDSVVALKTAAPRAARPAVAPLPAGSLVFPVSDHSVADVISVFGDKRGKTRRHQGIDVKAPRGTAVVATVDGFVERIREGGNGGKQLYLRDARGRLFYYAHLDAWSVAEFDAVTAGQQLGTVGDTGNARGTTPHLHFEILLGKERRAVDPLPYWTGA